MVLTHSYNCILNFHVFFMLELLYFWADAVKVVGVSLCWKTPIGKELIMFLLGFEGAVGHLFEFGIGFETNLLLNINIPLLLLPLPLQIHLSHPHLRLLPIIFRFLLFSLHFLLLKYIKPCFLLILIVFSLPLFNFGMSF